MFIVFEGGDGCGKSTQSKLLVESLKAENPEREVLWTREPGGTPGAEEIRGLLMSGSENKWSAETELLLFNAARRDHVEKVIQPALERGAIVICDRFVGSTIAYQGVRGAELAQKAKRVHEEMIGLNPDLTLLLDRPAADASVEARGMDRMELAQNAFKHKTRSEFSALLAKDPSWVGVFTTDLDETRDLILNIVQDRLSGRTVSHDLDAQRVFMDEEYLASLGPIVARVRKELSAPHLFDGTKRTDLLALGDFKERNPFMAAVVVESRQNEDFADVQRMTPVVNGLPIRFTNISQEQAETMIYEKIDADLPDLMAEYSGFTQSLTPELD